MMDMPIAITTQLVEHGRKIGTIRDDLPTSLLLTSVMGLGMAVDRWAVEHAEHLSQDDFDTFHEKIFGMFMNLLLPIS